MSATKPSAVEHHYVLYSSNAERAEAYAAVPGYQRSASPAPLTYIKNWEENMYGPFIQREDAEAFAKMLNHFANTRDKARHANGKEASFDNAKVVTFNYADIQDEYRNMTRIGAEALDLIDAYMRRLVRETYHLEFEDTSTYDYPLNWTIYHHALRDRKARTEKRALGDLNELLLSYEASFYRVTTGVHRKFDLVKHFPAVKQCNDLEKNFVTQYYLQHAPTKALFDATKEQRYARMWRFLTETFTSPNAKPWEACWMDQPTHYSGRVRAVALILELARRSESRPDAWGNPEQCDAHIRHVDYAYNYNPKVAGPVRSRDMHVILRNLSPKHQAAYLVYDLMSLHLFLHDDFWEAIDYLVEMILNGEL